MFVTQNLHNALSVLSSHHPGRWWIDQICIDQNHVPEKNEQVLRMGDVYSGASEVFVWLGRDVLDAQAAHALDEIARLQLRDPTNSHEISEYIWKIRLTKWLSIIFFFMHSWFERVWILQEVALAKHVKFISGGTDLPLSTVEHALRNLQILYRDFSDTVNRNASVDIEKYFDFPRDLATARTSRFRPLPLDKWLSLCRGRKAKDPRDFVFAGVSLLWEDVGPLVPERTDRTDDFRILSTSDGPYALGTDYSKSLEDVFIAFTHSLLRGPLGINALSLVGIRRNLGLFPSWVVNMDQGLLPRPLHSIQSADSKEAGPERVGTGESNSPLSRLLVAGLAIFPEAIQFDKVWKIGEVLTREALAPTFLNSAYRVNSKPFPIMRTLDLVLDLGSRYQHTGELILTAMSRTLTLDTLIADSADHEDRVKAEVDFGAALRLYLKGQENAFLRTAKSKKKLSPSQGPDSPALARHRLQAKTIASLLRRSKYKSTGFPEGFKISGFTGLLAPFEISAARAKFWKVFQHVCDGRRLFVTERGFLAFGPSTTRPGDSVMLLKGAWAPYIFRPQPARESESDSDTDTDAQPARERVLSSDSDTDAVAEAEAGAEAEVEARVEEGAEAEAEAKREVEEGAEAESEAEAEGEGEAEARVAKADQEGDGYGMLANSKGQAGQSESAEPLGKLDPQRYADLPPWILVGEAYVHGVMDKLSRDSLPLLVGEGASFSPIRVV